MPHASTASDHFQTNAGGTSPGWGEGSDRGGFRRFASTSAPSVRISLHAPAQPSPPSVYGRVTVRAAAVGTGRSYIGAGPRQHRHDAPAGSTLTLRTSAQVPGPDYPTMLPL